MYEQKRRTALVENGPRVCTGSSLACQNVIGHQEGCSGDREQESWADTVPHEEVEDGEEEMNRNQLLSTQKPPQIFKILHKDLTNSGWTNVHLEINSIK